MGLSICKKIIDRVGGKIDCFSRGPKKGSTFFFSMKMPIPKKQNSLAIVEETNEEHDTINDRILLVQDSVYSKEFHSYRRDATEQNIEN